jgi:hypothetical protein
MPYTRITSINESNTNIGYNMRGEEFYISDELMLNVPFFITYTFDEIEILVKADVDDNEELMIMKDFYYAEDSFQTKEDIILYDLQEFNKLIREV